MDKFLETKVNQMAILNGDQNAPMDVFQFFVSILILFSVSWDTKKNSNGKHLIGGCKIL